MNRIHTPLKLNILLLISIAILFITIAMKENFAQIIPDKKLDYLLNESLKSVLNFEGKIEWKEILLDVHEQKNIEENLKMKKQLSETVYCGIIQNNKDKFYILLKNAPSKSEIFTFALYLHDEKGIVDVDVIIYREQYGNEIDLPMFRRQFAGKVKPNQIIFGRTIQGISGATISSRSITYAIRDLLTVYQVIKPKLNAL